MRRNRRASGRARQMAETRVVAGQPSRGTMSQVQNNEVSAEVSDYSPLPRAPRKIERRGKPRARELTKGNRFSGKTSTEKTPAESSTPAIVYPSPSRRRRRFPVSSLFSLISNPETRLRSSFLPRQIPRFISSPPTARADARGLLIIKFIFHLYFRRYRVSTT